MTVTAAPRSTPPLTSSLADVPDGVAVWAERDRPREAVRPGPSLMHPGSVVIIAEAPGHIATRLPVVLAAGETVKLAIAPPAAVPPET